VNAFRAPHGGSESTIIVGSELFCSLAALSSAPPRVGDALRCTASQLRLNHRRAGVSIPAQLVAQTANGDVANFCCVSSIADAAKSRQQV